MIFARIATFVVGLVIVAVIFDAAFRTFVLPRGEPVRFTRFLSLSLALLYRKLATRLDSYASIDRLMATFGPLLLLMFPITWLSGLWFGFGCLFWGAADVSFDEALHLSASSLFTLGSTVPSGAPAFGLVIAEAMVGVIFTAILISYLPTIYGAFSRREIAVTQLAVRAGSPATPTDLLVRAHRAQFMTELDSFWNQWENWFVEVEETHTSLAVLPFFRSPKSDRSWITAAGCVLDSAAIRMSTLNIGFSPQAGLCIRSGFLALRSIADYFEIPYDPDPAADDPISVSREEFFAVYEKMAEQGVPVRPDREHCYRDYAGWRVNYDAALIGLCSMLVAPLSPWSSDRGSLSTPYRPGWRRRR